jgi:hypothetical protein
MAAVYSFNDASIRLHESLGFQREGRWRRMGYSEGQYFDHLFYGLTVEEFAANHPHVPLGAEWVRQARYTGSAQGEG